MFVNNMRVLLCLAVTGALAAGAARAEVSLPSLVADNMVLQRDSAVTVWGWASPAESISITFQGHDYKTRASRTGQWSVPVGPFAAGGPYDLTIRAKNTIILHNILIGDVWVASGQSNMEFPIKASGEWRTGVNDADKEIAGATFPQIRLFKVHHTVALKPKSTVEADPWIEVTPETVGSFSAVAYLFGRELHQRYHVPMGLIESNWGATVAEAWMSEASLHDFAEFHRSIEDLKRMDEKRAVADYDQYRTKKTEWYAAHLSDDRGYMNGHAVWADPDFNTAAWPAIAEPQAKAEDALKGFDGVVWFRKEIGVPEEYGGNGLHLHLPAVAIDDTTYFNGEKIGETQGPSKPRDYFVPGKFVKAGRNVVAVRIKGTSGHVGMFGAPDQLYVDFGNTRSSLAGAWSYQAGPDLGDLPTPSALGKFNANPNTSTLLFNGMIEPLTRYRIKGVIWYQGESNADRALQYRKVFPALIRDWRHQWGYDVPFLFVQLAGFGPNKSEPAEYPWAELREAQTMALSLPLTGMVTAIDIGDEVDIHPKNKQAVAHRLVLAAAKVAYGENITDAGPTYASMRIEGDRIRLNFSNLDSGLLVIDKYGYGRGFEIASDDGKFVWTQARQDGDSMVVFSEATPHPVAVRYDWSNTPDGNLYNKEELPAVPFRTDAAKKQ